MQDKADNSEAVYVTEKREASVLVIHAEVATKLLSDKDADRFAVELEDLLRRYRIAAVQAHFEFAEPTTAES